MQYREIGKTGVPASVLGFGCMRLPMEAGGKKVDDTLAVPLLRAAYEQFGVNYYDTAWSYCNEDSQRALGAAVRPFRDKILISTKIPMWNVRSAADFKYYLDGCLSRLGTDRIDFLHFHAMNRGRFDNVKKHGYIAEMEAAKRAGIIGHICFSFHDLPGVIGEIIDFYPFEAMLCQYNLIDRENEKMMEYAKSRGTGVLVMGPVGGGNIALAGKDFLEKFETMAKTPSELALRFVLGNPNVDVALSGMSTMEQLFENAAAADAVSTVTNTELSGYKRANEQISALSKLYCTGCDYCLPCPKGIQPSRLFNIYNRFKVWGLVLGAKSNYNEYGKNPNMGTHPDECTACGRCLKKCPQNIDIPAEIKRINSELKQAFFG